MLGFYVILRIEWSMHLKIPKIAVKRKIKERFVINRFWELLLVALLAVFYVIVFVNIKEERKTTIIFFFR